MGRKTTNRAEVLAEVFGRGSMAEIRKFEVMTRRSGQPCLILRLFDSQAREATAIFRSRDQARQLADALYAAVGIDSSPEAVMEEFLRERRQRRESDTSTIPSEGAVVPQEPRNAEIGSPVTTQAGEGQER